MVNTDGPQRSVRTALLKQANPSQNFGSAAQLPLSSEAGSQREALLSFSNPCPLGATVVSAILHLYQKGAATGGSRTLTARRIETVWKSSTVTWNRRPDLVGVGIDSDTKGNGGDDGRDWTFDVTNHLQTVADGADWYGWLISSNVDIAATFFSAEAPDWTPVLEVAWRQRPEAPETLAPSGNRSISTAEPLLRYDFVDVGGDTTLAACQVQIDTAADWDDPGFDSGTVATSDPQLDLADTDYAGLSNGASTYWRVRVKDGSGLWSEWSDAARFSRTNKSTLAITNPADVAEPVVEDSTPPITWNSSGTQRAFQVIITDPDNAIDWLFNSTKQTSAEESYTLPKGVIRRDDKTYRVIVRVWDDEDRENIAGDRPYVQEHRDFVYNDDPTVDPVTNLGAAVDRPTPWVSTLWQRGDTPDFWEIWRDGDFLDKIEGPELRVGAADTTMYKFQDRTAPPRADHEYKVRADVNGKTSRVNPSVVARPAPYGVWLTDHDRDTSICFVGEDDGDGTVIEATLTETGENYQPVGSSKPVRVTSSKQGLSGTVDGWLRDIGNGVTGPQWRDRLQRLRDNGESRCQLTWADTSIVVRCYNISYTAVNLPDAVGLVYKARFEFHQVSDFPETPE